MPGKKTLLLVEDEEPILFSVQRILELTGEYEIITSTNGNEALKKISNIIPDLIISDIAMPGMDGIELCKTVRKSESTKSIPFIFLTGKRDRLLEGIESGSDDYLTKPFQVDELIAKIQALFRRIELSRDQAQLQKGNLKDYPLDKILQICTSQAFSGELVVQHEGKEAAASLEKGEISKIDFEGRSETEALDIIRGWSEGTFVLRAKGIKIRNLTPDGPPHFESAADADLTEAVKIADGTWWVGYRNPDTLLQLNVYLRQFKSGKRTINYLIDPGSPVDFPVITRKVGSVIGDLSNLNVYSINHQDPDVGMNAIFIKNMNNKAVCMTTEDNWRLVSHYEINPQSVKLVNEFKNWKVTLATHHSLQYIPSPYCHFKGAFLTYDPETRILFTGDLFGGISSEERINTLWADDADWNGIMAFHQLYMPTNKAIRYTVESIRKLNPKPLMIAPQHGNIIRGKQIDEFINRLYRLPVGVDLLDIDLDNAKLEQYQSALNEVLAFAIKRDGEQQITDSLLSDEQFCTLAKLEGNTITRIGNNPTRILERMVTILNFDKKQADVTQIKSVVLKAFVTRGLPAPSLDWEGTEAGSPGTNTLFE